MEMMNGKKNFANNKFILVAAYHSCLQQFHMNLKKRYLWTGKLEESILIISYWNHIRQSRFVLLVMLNILQIPNIIFGGALHKSVVLNDFISDISKSMNRYFLSRKLEEKEGGGVAHYISYEGEGFEWRGGWDGGRNI